VILFNVELNLFDIGVHLSFYSSRSGSYIETQGPIGGTRVVETLYCRTLMARSSK
jgi:hypothetical protein